MSEIEPSTATKPRPCPALWRAALALVLVIPVAAPALAGPSSRLEADYFISGGGFRVGEIDVEGHFSSSQYAIAISGAISGATHGFGRIVSDARAILIGSGRISNRRIVPRSYSLETAQRTEATRVSMSMRGGAVTKLRASPDLIAAADRIPVRASHKRNIVDPVGAFAVPAGTARGTFEGKRACARTIRVFDGWQRFDVKLGYKQLREMSGYADSYNGPAVICSARYVPVAGHRPELESVRFMSDNKRLEIWLAPIKGARVMVPIRILIATKAGDLVISASKFTVSRTEQQALSR